MCLDPLSLLFDLHLCTHVCLNPPFHIPVQQLETPLAKVGLKGSTNPLVLSGLHTPLNPTFILQSEGLRKKPGWFVNPQLKDAY